MEDKVYLETYYRHQLRNFVVEETPTNIKAHGLQITRWIVTKRSIIDEAHFRN